jgi:predicted short-subunit dehydrogenase-like oxidoreductase (DUF2520 family)
MYIIAVKDDVIDEVAKKIKLNNKLVVHTSGSTALHVLKNTSNHYGVFYPLQTFSKNKKVDFKTVPICLEANGNTTLKVLQQLAKTISTDIYNTDFNQRKALHLAAVFACNFTNHLYSISSQLLKKYQLPFDILKPLIQETATKIENNSPAEVQTGPAIRGDKKIMEMQLKMLSTEKEFLQVYKLLSKSIIISSKKNK